MRQKPRGLAGVLVSFAAVACNGQIADLPPDEGNAPSDRSPTDTTPTSTTPTTSPAAKFQPAPAGLRRLTRIQYANAIRDLLGADVAVPPTLDGDTVLSGFASIGAALTTYSATTAEKLESLAMNVAQQALGDPARRARLVSCVPKATVDDACARAFLASIGRRAWRRPPADDELARYVAIAKLGAETLGDFWQGLSYALAGVLQSPSFLYRVEIGGPGPTRGQRVFDSWELATRLSFFLWNTTPDDALLAAAEGGTLTRPGELQKQAERLLASPRARLAMKDFFGELLRLEGLDDLEQSPTAFPMATRTIGPAMREETLRFLDEIVFGAAGDYRRAIDAPTTFVNRELARLYGLPQPAGTGFEPAALPSEGLRVGLLGQASFLALNAHETSSSPTRRGKFVREVLLCHEIPSPPPDVDTSLPEDPKGSAPRTMREKLSAHNVPGCAACHSRMDPIGLAFENFDAIGKLRTTEVGKPIDASGALDGARFGNARELAGLLRAHPDIDGCLTRGLYRYAVAHVETAGEEGLLARIAAAGGNAQQRFRALLLGIVDSEGFRVAAETP